jgi:hypothetical protein
MAQHSYPTTTSLSEPVTQALDAAARQATVSRSAMVRAAVDYMLAGLASGELRIDAFGWSAARLVAVPGRS